MEKLTILFFAIAVIGLFLGAFALVSVQGAYDQRDVKLEQTVNGILLDVESLKEVAKTHEEAIQSQAFDTSKLRNQTEANYEQLKDEIVKNRKEIRSTHPIVPLPDSGEQVQDDLFLTFVIEKTKWIQGDTIAFSGIAQPNSLVSVTANTSGVSMKGSTVSDEIGRYVIDIRTEFDIQIGIWTAFARSGNDQSPTLKFEIIE